MASLNSVVNCPVTGHIILSAVEYALPRQTYLVSITQDYVIWNWHAFGSDLRAFIHRRIRQALDADELNEIDLPKWKVILDLNT